MKRKDFIQLSTFATTAMMVPGFLRASGVVNSNGKKLVVVQLSGGNDGLNTIVPYRNDIYYKSRPTLALKEDKIIKLDDDLAMNDSMAALKELYDQGLVTIINNVGYPNPDRSHFRSMDIWQTASDSKDYITTGWLGRYLDASCAGCTKPISAAIEIDDSLSLALKGEHVNGLALHDVGLFNNVMKDAKTFNQPSFTSSNDNLNYLYKTLAETSSSADYLYQKSNIYHSKASYPNNTISKDLKTIADLIISGVETPVFYTSVSGFDTHVNQQGAQANHLKEVSEGLRAFIGDLKTNGRLDDVTVFIFSEFGRRVSQNASNGTDHGTANNVFVINSRLKKAGIFNETPDLEKLDQGDLIHHIDFRQIYATLLNKCLDANDELILGRKFEQLNLV